MQLLSVQHLRLAAPYATRLGTIFELRALCVNLLQVLGAFPLSFSSSNSSHQSRRVVGDVRMALDDAGTRGAKSLSATIAATILRSPASHSSAPGAVNTASMSAS
jgi:hypothetical protein